MQLREVEERGRGGREEYISEGAKKTLLVTSAAVVLFTLVCGLSDLPPFFTTFPFATMPLVTFQEEKNMGSRA